MLSRFFSLIAVLCLVPTLQAQTVDPSAKTVATSRFQVYGGYSRLSNTMNGLTGSHKPMNGWDASFAFASWHGLRFKLETFAYSGTNLGASEYPFFIMGGGQYSHRLRRETIYVEGLGGDCKINNRYWGPNQAGGELVSFSSILGGGLDTPLNRHFAIRVGGDFQYANFALVTPKYLLDYRVPGMPNFFGRVSTGLVWGF